MYPWDTLLGCFCFDISLPLCLSPGDSWTLYVKAFSYMYSSRPVLFLMLILIMVSVERLVKWCVQCITVLLKRKLLPPCLLPNTKETFTKCPLNEWINHPWFFALCFCWERKWNVEVILDKFILLGCFKLLRN